MMVCRTFRSALVPVLALVPVSGWACAACYGQSDSPLAAGMNWGILSLLGFILFVLGGVAGFFFFLARKSAALNRATALGELKQAEFEGWTRSSRPAGFVRRDPLPLPRPGPHRPCRSAIQESEVAPGGNRR